MSKLSSTITFLAASVALFSCSSKSELKDCRAFVNSVTDSVMTATVLGEEKQFDIVEAEFVNGQSLPGDSVNIYYIDEAKMAKAYVVGRVEAASKIVDATHNDHSELLVVDRDSLGN